MKKAIQKPVAEIYFFPYIAVRILEIGDIMA